MLYMTEILKIIFINNSENKKKWNIPTEQLILLIQVFVAYKVRYTII